MKRASFLLAIIAITFSSNAQVTEISRGDGQSSFRMTFTPRDKEDSSEKFKKIAHKMYLTTAYLPSKVDNINETFYLRYNIYRDEMEFIKDNNVVYLRKESGREVFFTGLNTNYQVFEVDGNMQYFVTHNKGKNTLLSKLRVRFLEEKPAKSGYDKSKPANFKRLKDVLYIAFDNANPVKIPLKKKDFYKVFSSKSSEIKTYAKKNKLGNKKLEDIKKIVEYYNTL